MENRNSYLKDHSKKIRQYEDLASDLVRFLFMLSTFLSRGRVMTTVMFVVYLMRITFRYIVSFI